MSAYDWVCVIAVVIAVNVLLGMYIGFIWAIAQWVHDALIKKT